MQLRHPHMFLVRTPKPFLLCVITSRSFTCLQGFAISKPNKEDPDRGKKNLQNFISSSINIYKIYTAGKLTTKETVLGKNH